MDKVNHRRFQENKNLLFIQFDKVEQTTRDAKKYTRMSTSYSIPAQLRDLSIY